MCCTVKVGLHVISICTKGFFPMLHLTYNTHWTTNYHLLKYLSTWIVVYEWIVYVYGLHIIQSNQNFFSIFTHLPQWSTKYHLPKHVSTYVIVKVWILCLHILPFNHSLFNVYISMCGRFLQLLFINWSICNYHYICDSK